MKDITIRNHEKYGLLVTVSSLLLVIVYSDDNYDSWDLMISCIAGYFAISFMINKLNTDWFSSLTASFIIITSLCIIFLSIENTIVSESIWLDFKPLCEFLESKIIGLTYHFIVVLIGTVTLPLILLLINSKQINLYKL